MDRSLNGYNMTTQALLIGKEGKGIMFVESSNDGVSWYDSFGAITDATLVPYQMSVQGYHQFIACGNETGGKLLECKGNSNWFERNPRPEGNTTEVKAYTAVCNTEWSNATGASELMIGFEAKDGSYGVFYSNDFGLMDGMLMADPTFDLAEGVAGIPTAIYSMGDNFIMTTANNLIQMSDDGGHTWTTIYTSDTELGKMAVASDQKAAVICGTTPDASACWV